MNPILGFGTVELAARLGKSVPTIHRWVRQGRLPRPIREQFEALKTRLA